MIKNIATVAVYVDDQDKALDFWTKKIGFEKFQDNDMGNGFRWLEVGPKGENSVLVLYPKKLMPNWKELSASIVFSCENIDEYYKSLKKKGVEFEGSPKKMQWGTFVSFKDIDGNQFLLRG